MENVESAASPTGRIHAFSTMAAKASVVDSRGRKISWAPTPLPTVKRA
jgi:hypothetical protein